MQKHLYLLLELGAAILLLASISYIYWWHNLCQTEVGIEGIKELGAWPITPALIGCTSLLIAIAAPPSRLTGICHGIAGWTALFLMGLAAYLAAVHTGVRSAVSVFDHPQYLCALGFASAQVALWVSAPRNR